MTRAIETLMRWHAERPAFRWWSLAQEPGIDRMMRVEMSELRFHGEKRELIARYLLVSEAELIDSIPDALDLKVKEAIQGFAEQWETAPESPLPEELGATQPRVTAATFHEQFSMGYPQDPQRAAPTGTRVDSAR